MHLVALLKFLRFLQRVLVPVTVFVGQLQADVGFALGRVGAVALFGGFFFQKQLRSFRRLFGVLLVEVFAERALLDLLVVFVVVDGSHDDVVFQPSYKSPCP